MKRTGEIICTDFAEGKKHDFQLFKDSKLPLQKTQKIIGDGGYTGMKKVHKNCEIPKKKGKKKELNKRDKKKNLEISKARVLVENVIGDLKVWRILSEKYRHRRNKYDLRFNIAAALYNQGL